MVLAEFGDTQHSAYPDGPDAGCAPALRRPAAQPDPGAGPHGGQLHALAARTTTRPTTRTCTSTGCESFYEHQSSGQYSIDGDVTEWVKVPFNEARYGRDDCGDIVCTNTWFLVRDALADWVQDQLDAGWTMAQIQDYLKTFDHQDRYDFDGDGDFDEPDGYIDHFQIVHAGGDEADGDPIYGADAIWSHRWNAQIHPLGTGPEGGAPIGGVNIGEGGASDPTGGDVQIPDNPTGVWVNDYTIQPENGGLSVFAHEFAHDLGLPDLYDTSGNTGGAENSVGFWTLMSQSRGTAPGDQGIGDQPHAVRRLGQVPARLARLRRRPPGARRHVQLRPGPVDQRQRGQRPGRAAAGQGRHARARRPVRRLRREVLLQRPGDDLNNTMTRDVDRRGALTAKVRYDIEEGWDYAFLEASSDGGETWTAVATSESYEGEDRAVSTPAVPASPARTDGDVGRPDRDRS